MHCVYNETPEEMNAYQRGIFDTVVEWVNLRQAGKHTKFISEEIFRKHGMNVKMIIEPPITSDAYSPYESDEPQERDATIVDSATASSDYDGLQFESDLEKIQCPGSPSYVRDDEEVKCKPDIPRPPSEVFKNST